MLIALKICWMDGSVGDMAWPLITALGINPLNIRNSPMMPARHFESNSFGSSGFPVPVVSGKKGLLWMSLFAQLCVRKTLSTNMPSFGMVMFAIEAGWPASPTPPYSIRLYISMAW